MLITNEFLLSEILGIAEMVESDDDYSTWLSTLSQRYSPVLRVTKEGEITFSLDADSYIKLTHDDEGHPVFSSCSIMKEEMFFAGLVGSLVSAGGLIDLVMTADHFSLDIKKGDYGKLFQ